MSQRPMRDRPAWERKAHEAAVSRWNYERGPRGRKRKAREREFHKTGRLQPWELELIEPEVLTGLQSMELQERYRWCYINGYQPDARSGMPAKALTLEEQHKELVRIGAQGSEWSEYSLAKKRLQE